MSTNNYIEIQIGVESFIYQISESDKGTLGVSLGKIGYPLSPVAVTGPSPSNRSKFSLSLLNNSSFLLIGGDGPGINTTELWAFDIKSSQWAQLKTSQDPIKRRSGHCAASSGNIVYIFGGSNGLNISTDLIVFTINGDTYTYKEIESQSDWPCPRILHTMIPMKNTIWLFGGQSDNGTALNDLWELDYSLFPQSPSWHAVELRRAPPGRYNHVSWTANDCFYIAGGMGSDDLHYQEVWKFENQWEQTYIINTKLPLFACSKGLFEVSDSFIEVQLSPPFAALDNLFERLKFKQSELTTKIRNQTEREYIQNETSRRLKRFENIIDQNKTNEYQEILNYFSDEEQIKLNAHINLRRNQLSEIVARIINDYPNFLQKPSNNPQAEELAVQLSLKLQQCEATLQKAKEERNTEIQLYKQQLQFLNAKQDVSSIIDTANFNSFLQYSSMLPPESKEAALENYYRIQLREYQRLRQQTQEVQQKFKKTSESQSVRSDTVSRLSDELTKKFKNVTKTEDELNLWKQRLEEANTDLEKVRNFLMAINGYKNNKPVFESNIQKMENNMLVHKNMIKRELDDICVRKKAYIDEFLKTINVIIDAIKTKNYDPQGAIDINYPKLQKLRDEIINSK
ncbi:hypothetical protein TRFO_38069 [Tritrichomonas foetus]|uniref:Kelch motif family protein n=1 Tax=Tritrichomonas foetus TaxID=1144522 RepID=A0A1J4J9G7_9EUKA|nr:hypothetical protein TRFO_38069 [Tritrichomonas foetus]|eukprot:OHS95792.1 hypothetical protein TRFO_38069 [Tritrichomonas foetus]